MLVHPFCIGQVYKPIQEPTQTVIETRAWIFFIVGTLKEELYQCEVEVEVLLWKQAEKPGRY